MTQDEKDERELFVRQVGKDVVSLFDVRDLTPSEILDICEAIVEMVREEVEEHARATNRNKTGRHSG